MLAYCAKCGTAYAIDLTACPHCGSVEVDMVLRPAAPVFVGEQGPELIDAAELAALNAGLATLDKPKEA